MRSQLLVAAALAGSLVVAFAIPSAAQEAPPSVASAVDVITSADGQLIVNVREAQPLLGVIRYVCREVGASCTFAPGLPARTVAKGTVRGSWVAVVADLFQGS